MSTSVLVRGTLRQRHSRVPTNDATSSHRLHSIERESSLAMRKEDSIQLSIHWGHTLYRASVLPKQFPGLLGTILDGSLLRRRILQWRNHLSKLVLILPTSDG